jgi:predicted RNA binding protein YcfA (HicA-like mRNA interferase family)
VTKLPLVTGAELSRILARLGFTKVRQKGSHAYFVHPDGRSTVVPLHSGETIGRGLVRAILREIGIDRKEYERLRRES